MSVRFRNLDFDPAAPLDEWPAEAIQTLIDRGSLSDWRRLAAAIEVNPWGPAARTTETVVAWGEHYGVDILRVQEIRGCWSLHSPFHLTAVFEPTRTDSEFDSPIAHLVDLGDRDGQRAGMAERRRRDQRAQPDRRRLAGDTA